MPVGLHLQATEEANACLVGLSPSLPAWLLFPFPPARILSKGASRS